jgi:transcriptional regulator with XRE-family HTH domain
MKKKSNIESSEKADLRKPLLSQAGKYLRQKREDAGLSQGDVAKAAGLTSPQFISNIERGIALPSPHLMGVMVAKYKFDSEEFLELIAELKMDYYRRLYFPKSKKIAN